MECFQIKTAPAGPAAAASFAPVDMKAWLASLLEAYATDVISSAQTCTIQSQLKTISFDAIVTAIELAPSRPHKRGELRLYQEWIAANGDKSAHLFAAWFNLGVLLAGEGDRANAAIAYANSRTLRPNFTPAAINLGLTYETLGQPDTALQMWHAAIQSDEERTTLLNHKARLLEGQGRLDEALDTLRISLLTNPKQHDVIQHWVHIRQKMCQWPVLAADIPGLLPSDLLNCSGPLGVMALSDDVGLQRKVAGSWIARKMPPAPSRLSPPQGYNHTRIKIGYMSSDFCRHAMSFLIAELFERHDRDRFEVFGYCSTRDDGSAIRARVIAAFDHFRLIRELSDQQAAQVIRDDEIDILIDLNGLTAHTRLAVLRWRPAPIQATYLGFVGPVPLPELDYLFCDDFVIPPAQFAHYAPAPVRIAENYQANDSKRIIGQPLSRRDVGLPEDGFVLCCFSNHYKITETVFNAWMKILQKASTAVLWLSTDNSWSQSNLCAAAARAGIEPERIVFAERTSPELYMSRLRLADLFLDTFPYNAGTVASDVLRMGVPLITMCGEAFASRMAGSLLHSMAALKGITTNLGDYIDTAAQLANNPSEYACYRALFTPQNWSETIGNIDRFTDEFETALISTLNRNHVTTSEYPVILDTPQHIPVGSDDCLMMPVESKGETEHAATLLIEGWRGLNHSYGLVNQFQILELLKIEGLRLFHQDLPFFSKSWNRKDNSPHFPPVEQQKIDALPPPDRNVDCVYRISSPIASGAEGDRRKTLTFMITETGLTRSSFSVDPKCYPFFTRDENAIITTTRWSRDRIAEYGFPAEKIHILPHGADRTVFHPASHEARAFTRAGLGIHVDEILFVNVGGTFWNKGGDLLLRAFAELRLRGLPVRLIVKDQRGLYGIPFETAITTVAKDCPALRRADTLDAISIIPGNLSQTQLRDLYAIADCYVSPYRAEGFNLPVLEAIACGTPVIVTEGGATDDFCPDGVAIRIPGQPGTIDASGAFGRYIEPDLDALIAAMSTFAKGHRLDKVRFAISRNEVLESFSWQQAARGLAALAAGRPLATSTGGPAAQNAQPARLPQVRRQDVLDLMQMVRPRRMATTRKVRVGNDYDGGYVLPETALGCNAVLSIGVGNDVSFDFDMAQHGAMILQFDHTVERPPSSHPNFIFHKLGWGIRTEGNFMDFDDMCAQLASLGNRRRLLKFDIEGAEYDVFDTVGTDSLAFFEVITCEIHDLDKLSNPTFFEKTKRFFEKLTRHHAPMHVHGNNYRGVAVIEGVSIPEVLEISLLRRDLDIFPGLANDPIPGPLDRPNHPYLPDMCLTLFEQEAAA